MRRHAVHLSNTVEAAETDGHGRSRMAGHPHGKGSAAVALGLAFGLMGVLFMMSRILKFTFFALPRQSWDGQDRETGSHRRARARGALCVASAHDPDRVRPDHQGCIAESKLEG